MMVKIRFTTEPGFGQVHSYPNLSQVPFPVLHRVNSGTAALIEDRATAALEPGNRSEGLRRTAPPKAEATPRRKR